MQTTDFSARCEIQSMKGNSLVTWATDFVAEQHQIFVSAKLGMCVGNMIWNFIWSTSCLFEKTVKDSLLILLQCWNKNSVWIFFAIFHPSITHFFLLYLVSPTNTQFLWTAFLETLKHRMHSFNNSVKVTSNILFLEHSDISDLGISTITMSFPFKRYNFARGLSELVFRSFFNPFSTNALADGGSRKLPSSSDTWLICIWCILCIVTEWKWDNLGQVILHVSPW